MNTPADEELRDLERRLRGIAESAMRRERLLAHLEGLDEDGSYELLAAVLTRPGVPAPHLGTLRDVLQDVLRSGGATRPLPHELRANWLRLALGRDDEFLARILRASSAGAVMDDPEAELPHDVAELPLGVRRSLARGVDVAMLQKLLLDPDPIVLDHLLRNPRVTEAHVLRIAARRPISEAALRAISRSPRFGVRPRVRVALARNPYCPADLAVQWLGTLPTPDLREIARDGTLLPALREHASEELERRHKEA